MFSNRIKTALFFAIATLLLLATLSACSNTKPSLIYHPKLGLETSTKVAVFVFLSDDCPLCKYYRPEIARIDALLQEKPNWKLVSVIQAKPGNSRNPFSSKEYFDDGSMARLFDVTVTPYVCVVNANSEKLYEGAWDNYAFETGKHRNKPSIFYLQNALDAIFQNKVDYTRKTEAYGCFIEP